MGSEMCIRDRVVAADLVRDDALGERRRVGGERLVNREIRVRRHPVSYTHLTLPTSDLV